MSVIGLSNIIIIQEPSILQKLFSKKKYSDRPYNLLNVYNLGEINGNLWFNRRKIFHNNVIKLIDSKKIELLQNNLIKNYLIPKIKNSKVWYPENDLMYLVFNLLHICMFGYQIDNNDKLYLKFNKLSQKVLTGISLNFLIRIVIPSAANIVYNLTS